MKGSIIVRSTVMGILFMTAYTASSQEVQTAPEAVQYSVKVQEFEGCECESVCPCVFSKDTTYGDCRATLAFTFNGTYGSTALNNVSCVVVGTKLGSNMEATVGTWEGVLYVSDTATPDEIAAVNGLLNAMMGGAFAKLDQRKAPIKAVSEGDIHELTLGEIAHLKIHAIKGPNGEPTKIVNAPSPIAFPEYYCAIADDNKYDDGTSSWAFTGRNAFYASFDLASTK